MIDYWLESQTDGASTFQLRDEINEGFIEIRIQPNKNEVFIIARSGGLRQCGKLDVRQLASLIACELHNRAVGGENVQTNH